LLYNSSDLNLKLGEKMKKAIFWVIVFLLLALLCFSEDSLQNHPGLSVRQTYELYTQAIINSDLKSLFATVTNNEKFFFLTTRGRLIDTLIFHKEDNLWKVAADVCTPISRTFAVANPDLKYTLEQKFVFDTIKQRRTVREFESTPVPKEHILKTLDAARYAPTAGNQQPWKFLVIQDREKYPDYVVTDGALAAGTLMIAARALGYGTGFYTSFFPEDKLKKFLNIPDHFKLICFTPIGIPVKWPETPPQKKSSHRFIITEIEMLPIQRIGNLKN
jgi:predicted oxidoreductase (fatty acid repression mutant protein)